MAKILMTTPIQEKDSTKLSDIDKQKKIVSVQIDLIYNSSVNHRQKLELDDLRRLEILSREVREISKFEKNLEEDISDNLTNEQLIKALKKGK